MKLTAHIEHATTLHIICDGLAFASLWRRIWVHQEILLANKVTVMGGQSTVSWNVLHLKRSLLQEDARYTSLYTNQFRELLGVRKDDQPVRDLPLLEVLERFGGGDCSDSRDRLYGLLGLVRPDQRVPVDYHLEIQDVAQAVHEKLVECHGNSAHTLERISDVLARRLGYYFEDKNGQLVCKVAYSGDG
jgi:hypothetical protein